MSLAKPIEGKLTWILFKGLKHFKLLILGFLIFKKFHSRPELWAFKHGLIKNPLIGCWYPLFIRKAWCLDPRAAIDLDLLPRANAHKADEDRLLYIWKIPSQSWVKRVLRIEEIQPISSNLEEIIWRVTSLHSHNSGPRGQTDMDSFSRASAHQVLGARLLNF